MAHGTAAIQSALEGRYVLERELGRGGMATVYLAEDLKLHRRVALKVLRPELAASLGNERFHREVEIAARLNHPNILPVHDSGEAGGRLYYAMPYVEGESLRQRLEREGQLPVPEVIEIIRAVASALDYAHGHGVVHRDIKPENILLGKGQDSDALHPMVADFGIARAVDAAASDRLTETGLALGTPAYMSPEQAASGRLDGRSDIYSLGCVAYEMLADTPPFTGPSAQAVMARHAVDPVPSLRTVRSTVSEAVEAAISQALAKVPADRFATAGEFARALVQERHRSIWSRKVLSRKSLRLGLAAAAIAAVAGIARETSRSSEPAVLPSASTIAVFPMRADPTDTALTRLGSDLAITASAALDGIGGIETTDRFALVRETAGRSLDSPSEIAKVARRLGARSVLRGTMVRDRSNVRVDLSLYDVEGFVPIARGITATGHRDSIAALTDSVVWAVLRQVWQRGEPPSPSLSAVTTKSFAALRAFLEGERAIERDDWDAAALAFRSAIAADSTFWLAYYRYVLVQYWGEEEPGVEFLNALQQHREALPERERVLVDAWSSAIRDSFPVEVERYREATRRFPNYWPAWFLLGDRLFHVGAIYGYRLDESRTAFARAVELNPRLKPAWRHLWSIDVRTDTAEGGRTLPQLSTLRSNLTGRTAEDAAHLQRVERFETELARSKGVITAPLSPLADSIALDWASADATSFRRQVMGAWALTWFGFPVAQVEWNRRVIDRGVRYPANLLRGIAWAWAERGAWDSALAVMREAVMAEPHPLDESPVTAVDEYGMAVLGAWLGVIDPAEAVRRQPAAKAVIVALGDGERRGQLLGSFAWLNGVLAFARRDRGALQTAREEARRMGVPRVDRIDRSLAAFGRALDGDRGRAGRELAKSEWDCAAACVSGDEFVTPNMAIHRLAAATWLLEAGDTAQAVRLLIWHQSTIVAFWDGSFTYAVAPLAYLMLARIEEAQGDTRWAKKHYQQFLQRHDAPMPRQVHLVDEARAALARLSGPD